MVHRAQIVLAPVQPVRSEYLQLVNKCFLLDHTAFAFDSKVCLEPPSTVRKRVLLIGDSHAASLYPGLKEMLNGEGIDLFMLTAGHCVPLVVSFPKNDSLTATSRCAGINRQVRLIIENSRYDLILIASHVHLWGFNTSGRWTYPGYYKDYLASISYITGLGNNVAVIGQFPIWPKGLPNILSKEIGWEQGIAAIPDYSKVGLDVGIFKTDSIVKNDIHQMHAAYLSVLQIVCNENGCNRFGGSDAIRRPFAVDYGHLSLGGSRFLSNQLRTPILDLVNCQKTKEKSC